MDVNGSAASALPDGRRVVSRPHVPALLWYGLGTAVFGLITIGVVRTIVWETTVMVLIPLCVAIAFSMPLFLSVRNLTAVAILEGDTLELRRCFIPVWRVQRQGVSFATPTKGFIEGPLALSMIGGEKKRMLPGFLVRGLRGTWVETLRNTVHAGMFEGMSPEEARAFTDTLHRSSVERDESLGDSPDERWKNHRCTQAMAKVAFQASLVLSVLITFAPPTTLAWGLALLNVAAAMAMAIAWRFFVPAGKGGEVKGIFYVLISLLPGFTFTRGMFDWQTQAPGFAVAGCWVAAVIWLVAGIPNHWRGFALKQWVGCLILSAMLFGQAAWWGAEMLRFANRHFDNAPGNPAGVAAVQSVHERIGSRYTPASLEVELGSTATFKTGLSARFALKALPPGDLVAGGRCVLVLRRGWLHVPWIDVVSCRAP